MDNLKFSPNKNSCLCGCSDYIVLACSGACDLGQITDIVARKLRDNGVRKMNCLATIGARIGAPFEQLKKNNILMLDGCSVDCGKKILDKAGFTDYKYLRITDFGYVKGKTPVSEETVNLIYEKAEIIY